MDIELIQKLLRDLQGNSSHRESHAELTVKKDGLHAYFRPCGYGSGQPSILEYGATPEEAIAKVSERWAEMSARVKEQQLKKLALAIIRITHEQGMCTDAALRAEFTTRELEMFSEGALQLANRMAENGPFRIVELAGANAA